LVYLYSTIKMMHGPINIRYTIPYLYLQPFPEDEPSFSKHVEDIIKITFLAYKVCILLVYIV